jgi:hypothetical protein
MDRPPSQMFPALAPGKVAFPAYCRGFRVRARQQQCQVCAGQRLVHRVTSRQSLPQATRGVFSGEHGTRFEISRHFYGAGSVTRPAREPYCASAGR